MRLNEKTHGFLMQYARLLLNIRRVQGKPEQIGYLGN